ncbi:MAG: sulfide/dihydroorotate dehydrogenase-like FAD/NAD-binding protein [Dehalococcoidia bacterium]|nr:sulfide/dihydroorotate dehydrogenase-like FAD/NAD-binding protein [Dehalococcoidia bacterium]
MYRIIENSPLVPNIHLVKVDAPAVANKAQAGQFVIIRVDEKGERVPLTLADWDREAGTVTIAFMEVGKTTRQLATMRAGDSISNFVGPLGKPTEIEKFGTVVCVAGGFAVATIVPIARAMRAAGNKVIALMGARNKSLLFWEDRLASVCDELIVTTDDGSYARKGVVTVPLKEMLEKGEAINRVIAVGPSIMMKFVAATTLPFKVKTIVSLNPIMVDGTGMCGACRCSVGGETKFACVDGPEVDGHQVDWEELFSRQRAFLPEEKQSLEMWQRHQAEATKVQT